MKKPTLIFLAIILIMTIVGVIIGSVGGNNKKKILSDGEIYFAIKNGSVGKSTIGIANKIFIDDYLEWVKGYKTSINFEFTALDDGQKLYLIDSVSENLFKVAVFRDKPTAINPAYEELYIWRGFVRK